MIAKPPRPLRRRGEGVPLIAATEPESHPCHPQEIPDQVRDEVGQAWDEGNRGRQNNPATPQGFTILPNTMGVHTPAYALSPLQGYIIFHFSLPSAIIVTTDFVFFLLARQSSYKYALHSLVRQFGID